MAAICIFVSPPPQNEAESMVGASYSGRRAMVVGVNYLQ